MERLNSLDRSLINILVFNKICRFLPHRRLPGPHLGALCRQRRLLASSSAQHMHLPRAKLPGLGLHASRCAAPLQALAYAPAPHLQTYLLHTCACTWGAALPRQGDLDGRPLDKLSKATASSALGTSTKRETRAHGLLGLGWGSLRGSQVWQSPCPVCLATTPSPREWPVPVRAAKDNGRNSLASLCFPPHKRSQ